MLHVRHYPNVNKHMSQTYMQSHPTKVYRNKQRTVWYITGRNSNTKLCFIVCKRVVNSLSWYVNLYYNKMRLLHRKGTRTVCTNAVVSFYRFPWSVHVPRIPQNFRHFRDFSRILGGKFGWFSGVSGCNRL